MLNITDKIKPFLLKVKNPSVYIGSEPGSIIKPDADLHFAFCFPDTYEIGMSHLGMKILYGLINSRENYACERVFAPAEDFENIMREQKIPLYGLETKRPLTEFDIIGFTLQYELSFTNILNMLDLAGIPVKSSQRGENFPLIIAGGPCACNPEPITDFIDLFVLGDGEEVTLELLDLFYKMKGTKKSDFLREAVKIQGIYVPGFYEIKYNTDKTIQSVNPKSPEIPKTVTKRIVKNLNSAYYPENFVVPFTEIVHDRAVEEVLRGCIRGCRFCQAGFIYRPYREKSIETITQQVRDLCSNTGYETVSLSSLSTSDYSEIEKLLAELNEYAEGSKTSISLPSMRIDRFSDEILAELMKIKKSGLTFAPEAGTQRLRDVINKNITADEIDRACITAFKAGYSGVKLYFMMGLPTETDDDIRGIAETAEHIIDLFYQNPDRKKGLTPMINVSVSTFVPKPFTPFEFVPQPDEDEIRRRQRLLLSLIRSKKKIKVRYNDYTVSRLEAVLARGDRRLCEVIYTAWINGAKFDSWDNYFKPSVWEKAFEENGVSPEFYANRERSYEEILPWDHLDYLIDKNFLIKENENAKNALTTPNCKEKCSNCGVIKKSGFCPVVGGANE
ncbi:MAG: TIGR03960 family B12-binding radical SAM protein [Ruminococcus sp.]|jgi:radical SAM family uncharacterized protein|nr:TIGR03960 family B12-binding radical SAM protein [Ruminococcus sp.]